MTVHALPNSAGAQAPRLEAPALACDSHLHIYDPRFPSSGDPSRLPANGTVAEALRNRVLVDNPARLYGF